MLPDRVSNPGPLTYESVALPIALRGPACVNGTSFTVRKISPRAGLEPGTARSVGQRLPH